MVTVDATAHDDARWYSGAGIYRPVHLVVGEPVHLALDGVHVTTPTVDDERGGRGGDRRGERVAGHDDDHRHDRDRRRHAGRSSRATSPRSRCSPAGPRRSGSDCSSSTPQRWSVDHPALYTCRTRARGREARCSTRESTAFGIRTIDVDPARGLRINGEPVELRGACIHHDNGVLGSRHDPARRRAAGREAEGGGLQRAAQRAPADEPRRCSTRATASACS